MGEGARGLGLGLGLGLGRGRGRGLGLGGDRVASLPRTGSAFRRPVTRPTDAQKWVAERMVPYYPLNDFKVHPTIATLKI